MCVERVGGEAANPTRRVGGSPADAFNPARQSVVEGGEFHGQAPGGEPAILQFNT